MKCEKKIYSISLHCSQKGLYKPIGFMNSTIHFYFVSLFSYKIWWLNWDTKVMTGVGWRYEFHVTIPFHYRKLRIIYGKRAKNNISWNSWFEFIENLFYIWTLDLLSLDTSILLTVHLKWKANIFCPFSGYKCSK